MARSSVIPWTQFGQIYVYRRSLAWLTWKISTCCNYKEKERESERFTL